MTTSTHTPGPWIAKPTAGHEIHGQSAVYGPDGKDIAIVYDGAANARLIASAPELLAILQRIIDRATAPLSDGGIDYSDVDAARAAIAAATGGA